ncbi:MAG: PLP-dependent aminotransferase family protein [Chloroflexota bacterium]
MSLERRQATVALAQQYQAPIIEDDPYGDLRYEGEPLSSLFDLAPEQVLYLGTFSKIFAPGFRLAWAVAKPEIMRPLMIAKQSADLQSATFSQFLVYESLRDGFLEGRIEEIRKYYHQQRNHMLEAIHQAFPDAVRYKVPSGGMFLWCELPEGKDASEILETALEHKVAYVPGRPFFPSSWQGGENTLRLSFSLVAPDEINEGIDRLGRVFKAVL